MCRGEAPFSFLSRQESYSRHLLVFLAVLFLGLSFTHPSITITDDWITVNQVHQLHEGHQIIVNEGKYGLFENGTVYGYFSSRGNVLGYSLFLPLISLPSFWLIDLFGEHFVFFVLYLWTFFALTLILCLDHSCSKGIIERKRGIVPLVMLGSYFIVFFINLFYYIPFSVNGPETFPEIIAVIFTNNLLLALAAVLIYEINQTLFQNTAFSLLGTTICLFSSSYFFWTTGCKDHILILVLFSLVLLSLIKFQKTNEFLYLFLAFLTTGLLAWARPELALWIAIAVVILWGYSTVQYLKGKSVSHPAIIFSAPFFIFLGALPFFLNNFLVMKNPLMPTGAIYLTNETSGIIHQISPAGSSSGPSLLQILTIKNPVASSDIPGDIFGILFHPQNGSMGILPVVPLFLVMVLAAIFLGLLGKMMFSGDEKSEIILLAFITLAVILAYANNLPQLNSSEGITPDMRYLLPMYLPLNLIGLIILKKVRVFSDEPVKLMRIILPAGLVGAPVSVLFMSMAYANPAIAEKLNAPLASFFTILIFSLAGITLILLVRNVDRNYSMEYPVILIALLCALPFVWQIDASIYVWQFATAEGYPPWIPVIRMISTVLSFPLMSY